jgi:arsenate reductase-like glutaredoxin family protein
MTITLYGIANCDTVAKARKWLEGNGYNYTFFDYKKGGADAGKLAADRHGGAGQGAE